jgi:hypothetical protein
MSVSKDVAARYTVRKDGEYAGIILDEWRNGESYVGEIFINSSFGSWAMQWGAMGSPLREFLLRINRDYLGTKLLGTGYQVLDFDKSIIKAHDISNEAHSQGELTAEQHEELGEWIDSLEEVDSEHGLYLQMHSVPDFVDHELLGTGAYIVKKEDPQFAGFYDQIWPEFCAAIRAEVEEKKARLVALDALEPQA